MKLLFNNNEYAQFPDLEPVKDLIPNRYYVIGVENGFVEILYKHHGITAVFFPQFKHKVFAPNRYLQSFGFFLENE